MKDLVEVAKDDVYQRFSELGSYILDLHNFLRDKYGIDIELKKDKPNALELAEVLENIKHYVYRTLESYERKEK